MHGSSRRSNLKETKGEVSHPVSTGGKPSSGRDEVISSNTEVASGRDPPGGGRRGDGHRSARVERRYPDREEDQDQDETQDEDGDDQVEFRPPSSKISRSWLHMLVHKTRSAFKQVPVDISNLLDDSKVAMELNRVYREHGGFWRAATTISRIRLTKVSRAYP
jgi:hypothetical protein